MAISKCLNELTFDASLLYFKEHTWARIEGGLTVVGISDYAQDQLGDIVFIELPHPGDAFGQGDVFGFVESVKTASDLNMPIGGEIVAINDILEDAPETVNNEPYGRGWMIKVKANDPAQLNTLFDAEAYRNSLQP